MSHLLSGLVGLAAGFGAAVALMALAHSRASGGEAAPTRLSREWRMWRENGRTLLELNQRLLREDGKGLYSLFTVTYAKGSEHGEEMWAAYLGSTDTLADASLGKVKMPVDVE